MKAFSFRGIASSIVLALATLGTAEAKPELVPTASVKQLLQNSAIPFIKNQGQKHEAVAFYAAVPGGMVFVDHHGALVYALAKQDKTWAFRERFISQGSLSPQIDTASTLPVKVQQGSQLRDVITAQRLSLGEIAKGVTLELQATANNVEKYFRVAAGADPTQISVKLEGVQGAAIAEDGQLHMETGLGSVAFSRPVAFQLVQGEKTVVDVSYVLKDNQYGFVLGNYDHTRELVIDPVLTATYLGGSDGYPTYSYDDLTEVIAAGDYIYAAGGTHSPDFPTALGFDDSFNWIRSGFVVRMSADLTTLVNATFIGGTVYDMKRESSGELVVAGQAYSGFPKTAGAYSYPSDYEQTGGFIARLSSDLTQLVAAGVVVPASSIQRIAMGNGRIYFSGVHNQENLALTDGAYATSCNCIGQGSFGANTFTGYLGSVTTDLSALTSLSWIGGSTPTALDVADDSSVYVLNGAYTIADGAIRQFDADVTSLLASQSFAYLGNAQTYFSDMVLADNFIVVAGSTKKNNLPASADAFDRTCGVNGDCDNTDSTYYIAKADAFLVRFSRDLQTIEALTYFGGSGHDSVKDLLLEDNGNLLFSGYAGDTDFPLSADAEQKKASGYFIARMSNDLRSLIYSTYIPVSGEITYAGNNLIYLSGSIGSGTALPVAADAFDTSYNGGASDGYIILYEIANNSSGGGAGGGSGGADNAAPVADAGADQYVVQRSTVGLNGLGSTDSDGRIVSYAWTQLEGRSVSINNADSAVASFVAPRVRKGRTRTLLFELTVQDDAGASASDQVQIIVTDK